MGKSVYEIKHKLNKKCPDCGIAILDVSDHCRKHSPKTFPRDYAPKIHLSKLDRGVYRPVGYKVISSDGYILMKMSHGKGNGDHRTYEKEHRVVVESVIGRKLTSKEHVHHIDGNRTNNSPDNLFVMYPRDHNKLNFFMSMLNNGTDEFRQAIAKTLKTRYPELFG